jgi:RecA/RadA recombinase
MLKAKKPEAIQKRLKALLYGAAGVGKTTAAIQFPNAYLIDTERGAENDQYIKLLKENKSVIFQTTDFDEIMYEIKALLVEKHAYKTLIIDPLTTVYNSLLNISALKVGTDYGRHYIEVGKQMKKMLNLLLRLDMNVIITSHAKNEYGDNMAVLGQTFDAYKKLDYLFDLVLEIKKEDKKRFAIVKKSRIQTFEELEKFEFNYETIADKYGKSSIESEAKKEELSTKEQLVEFYKYCELLHVEDETKQKWLEKGMSATFEEMNRDSMDKLIVYLKDKIQ